MKKSFEVIYKFAKKFTETYTYEPSIKLSKWADSYRILAGDHAAEVGRWNTSRAEYQRGPMDAISEEGIHTVVLMWAGQTGKTELINNFIGYFLHIQPSSILFVLPNMDLASSVSKDRIVPFIKSQPILRKRMLPRQEILNLRFKGGLLTLVGAGSATSLASRPSRVLLCDEVDRFVPDIAGEGDPSDLAIKRTSAFWNRVIVLASTPSIKGSSRIENSYLSSDQRKYHIPCFYCDHYQELRWANVVWENDDPSTAKYCCENCGVLLINTEIKNNIIKGKWVILKPENKKNGVAGFHLNELYSPFKSLQEIVAKFLEVKNNPLRLKTFINTSLAETWEDEGSEIEDGELYARREGYMVIPMNGVMITCGVDVQQDRIEGEVVAWGIGHESWSLEYFIILGDPQRKEIWNELDQRLRKKYKHETGIRLKIHCTFIDSRYKFDQVFNFCRPRFDRRIYPIMGQKTLPTIVSTPKVQNEKVRFYVGTDAAKIEIFGMTKINVVGPGYMHFPKSYGDEYFKSLTGEKIVTKYIKGFPKQEFIKFRRNEALDCRVYALAAINFMNPDFEETLEYFKNRKFTKEAILESKLEDDKENQNSLENSKYKSFEKLKTIDIGFTLS